MVEHPKSKSTQPRSSSTWEALYNEIFWEGEEENLTGRHWSVIKTPVSSWNGSMYILCQFPLIGWLSLRFRGARQWSGLHPVYRVVQLNFTPKIQVFYMLSERSHKQHILVWNLVGPTCKIIRQPHSLSQVVHVVLSANASPRRFFDLGLMSSCPACPDCRHWAGRAKKRLWEALRTRFKTSMTFHELKKRLIILLSEHYTKVPYFNTKCVF